MPLTLNYSDKHGDSYSDRPHEVPLSPDDPQMRPILWLGGKPKPTWLDRVTPKHFIITHLYALAAFGNTLTILWTLHEAWKAQWLVEHKHWLALFGIWMLCLLTVAIIRNYHKERK